MSGRSGDSHVGDEKEVVSFTIGVKERVVGLAFLVLVGGHTAVDLLTPYGRNDPNTGAEGRIRDDRLASHDQRMDALFAVITATEDRIDALEFAVQIIERTDADCQKRQESIEDRLNAHLAYSGRKVESLDQTLAQLQSHDRLQDRLIDDCMQRTQ